jgi:hypothetical protein
VSLAPCHDSMETSSILPGGLLGLCLLLHALWRLICSCARRLRCATPGRILACTGIFVFDFLKANTESR